MRTGDFRGVEKIMRSKIFTRTVGYWPLQEASGSALDYSGNGNHASTTNVSSYGVSGPVSSSAMEFDGTDGYIEMKKDNIPSATGGNIITLAAWINPAGTWSLSNQIFRVQEEWVLQTPGNGDSNLKLATWGNNTTFSAALTANEWQLVILVWDIGSSVKVYMNGQKTDDISYGDTSSDSGNPPKIAAGGSLDGKIAHVRVWDYPLSEASIRALYNASRGGFSESDSRTL